MSGYLTRIAERAMNAAPAVHANASLPFVPSPDLVPADESPTIEIEGGAPSPQGGPLRAPQAPLPAPGMEHRPPALKEEREEPSAELPPARAPVPPPPPALVVAAADAPIGASPQERRVQPPAPADSLATATPPRRARVSVPSAAHAKRATPARPAPKTEPPLPATALARFGAASPAAGRAPTPQAPDVHIHIGRIELTAVPEPAPSRRKPGAGRKPMSLDEYLQARARKP